MIKSKHILVEEEPKKASEDPNKILVKNKETGQSYYINKDNFDPSVHEKPEKKEKKKIDPPSEKPSSQKKSDNVSTQKKPKKDPPDAEESPKEKKEEPKKLSPSQKLEKKLGSFVFVDEKEKEEIADEAKSFRPDLKEKLLKFEFTSFFRNYDELLNNLSSQNSSKDNEGAKQTMKDIRKVAKKIQGIAIAKLAALGTFTNYPKTISSAKFYHSSNNVVNEILRNGDEILTNNQIEKIRKEIDGKESTPDSLPEYDSVALNAMQTINDLDDHFKSDGAKLQYDTVVYRGIKKSVLEKFVEAGDWVDNGFVSTTLNPIIAEDFTDRALVNMKPDRIERTPIFKINLKKGDRVLMLPCSEDEFCIESEITLPRGCKFTITDKDEEKNIYEVSVEFPDAR